MIPSTRFLDRKLEFTPGQFIWENKNYWVKELVDVLIMLALEMSIRIIRNQNFSYSSTYNFWNLLINYGEIGDLCKE